MILENTAEWDDQALTTLENLQKDNILEAVIKMDKKLSASETEVERLRKVVVELEAKLEKK